MGWAGNVLAAECGREKKKGEDKRRPDGGGLHFEVTTVPRHERLGAGSAIIS
jgi:hypothetical protein